MCQKAGLNPFYTNTVGEYSVKNLRKVERRDPKTKELLHQPNNLSMYLSGSSYTCERMRIIANENIGINNSSLSYQFDNNGPLNSLNEDKPEGLSQTRSNN